MSAAPVRDQVADLTAVVSAFRGDLVVRVEALVGVAGDREFAIVVAELERLIRTSYAAGTMVIDDVERRNLFQLGGHRTARAWTLATINVSEIEVTRRRQLVRLFRSAPEIRDRLADGSLGIDQARELARAAANPRCGDVVVDAIAPLVDAAMKAPFDEFRAAVQQAERLADQDGAHRDAQAAHEGRFAKVDFVGDTAVVRGEFGVLQGEVIRQTLEAVTEAEFRTDHDAASAAWTAAGNTGRVPITQLARTPRQRSADALFAMCVTAANAPTDTGRTVDVVVDILIDEATFEQRLADIAASPSIDPDTERACRLGTCRLPHGAAVDPTDALDNLSRCTWPGCRRTRIEIDHVTAWTDGGPTAVHNCGPQCGPHNRLKATGYTTRRDQQGHSHTYRPDGTELIAA